MKSISLQDIKEKSLLGHLNFIHAHPSNNHFEVNYYQAFLAVNTI